MSTAQVRSGEPVLHAVLIGCDAYPSEYNSLRGCVNDIDAVEALLLDPPGVGLPPERVRVTRLAAPHAGAVSATRLQGATRAPTKANIVATLRALSTEDVRAGDRVLVYYSGHGDQQRWAESPLLHECLVASDATPLWDVELNALIHAISRRTEDVTVVLDSCHSSGAYRDLQNRDAAGADRRLTRAGGHPADADDAVSAPPDQDLVALGRDAGLDRSAGGGAMLQGLQPVYVAVAACQADQTAGEGDFAGGVRHGILTRSLLSQVAQLSAADRAALRWGDAWPGLLDGVAASCAALRRNGQQPWMTGAAGRRVFGGPWEPRDVGLRVRRNPDGTYTVQAGRLLGISEGAAVAVYGAEPPRFPPLGSPADAAARPLLLEVVAAERSSCTARATGEPFDLPSGARGRLVKPGAKERLRVALDPAEPALVAALEASPLLEVAPPGSAEAEVGVVPQRGDPEWWAIGNDLEAEVALVPRGLPETGPALRAGLEAYTHAQTVVRLAKRSNDPQLSRRLEVRLLDCATAHALSDAQLEDPQLPEAVRDDARVYHMPEGFAFAVRVENYHTATLQIAVLNCAAGGAVEFLGQAEVKDGSHQIIWRAARIGLPFEAGSDFPGRVATDRLVVVGTTKRDVDLSGLEWAGSVQEVVNSFLPAERVRGDKAVGTQTRSVTRAAAPPQELWTAVEAPLRIGTTT